VSGGLRIGIDARAAVEVPAGRGTMVRELLHALDAAEGAHRYVLFARERWNGAALDERFSWRLHRNRDPAWNVRVGLSAAHTCDVFLSTNSYLTAWFTRVPAVVVICDLVSYHAELLPQRRARWIERATLPLAIRRAAALMAISQATAADLAGRFPSAAARITVTPLAASERFAAGGAGAAAVRARHGLDRAYVLGVGTLEPRKNLPRLIRAFAGLDPAVRSEHELVLVGPAGWETDETLAAIAGHQGLVRALGHVPDDDLPALYREATLFAYPSLYEGFGLPVLEAMVAGAPVLTSNRSSLPEVAGDAAFYVDPADEASIRDGLTRALTDRAERMHLSALGRERTRAFSWARFAEQTLAVCEGVAGYSRPR
jgi:glycosyltransferase involved in cell wall biosynthesis